MTSRNLNTTWRDVVFKQYVADLEADVPYPVRYLINIPVVYGLPGRDIWIEISDKIDLKTLKNSVLAFMLVTRNSGDPTYQDDHISIVPRLPRNSSQAATTARDAVNEEDASAETSAGDVALGQ